MCLILLAYDGGSRRPLVVAANRDEFYARPAHAARYWDGAPHVFGGRDLEAGGTWLGVSTGGRFAALTNYTDFDLSVAPAASRGELPRNFLEGHESALAYAQRLDGSRYQGFNLIVFDGTDLVYASNRTGDARILDAGVYGLTNTWLGDEWPKTKHGTAALAGIAADADANAVIELMLEESEGYLADGHEIESARRATPAFLRGEEYGTRASTSVIFEDGHVEFVEQLYGPMGVPGGRVTETIRICASGT